MKLLFASLAFAFSLLLMSGPAFADPALCNGKFSDKPKVLADIASALTKAEAANLDSNKDGKRGPFQVIWGNGTCTVLFIPKEGLEGQAKMVSVVYVQYKTEADYGVDSKVVPIRPNGSFVFSGLGTERCVNKEIVFSYEDDGVKADCGQSRALLKKM